MPEPSFYDRPAVFARYTSHRHDGTASPNIVMEEPALLAALGSVAGLRVVDLGCGDAELGEIVLAAGARSYVGVDGSAAMVASARSRLGAGAEVRHATIEEFGAPPGSVDVVVSRLALHYVADVRSVLSSACRWLSPAGRVVFSVVHPTITSHDARAGSDEPRTSWVVDDYFATGARERPWLGGSVTWYHRTVEDYVRALLDAGVTLTTLSECAPSLERFAGDTAEYRRRRRVPLFLLLAGTVSAGRR